MMSEPEFILSVPAPIEESVSGSDDGNALTAKKTKQQILDRLTTQQLKFCREMVRCPKPKQAAINAGCNPKSARQHACSLLHEEKCMYTGSAEAVTVPRKTEVTLRFSPSKAFADEQSLLGL